MAHHDDDILRRLRDSDPATGTHPDLHALRRRVGALVPASRPHHGATSGAERVTALDELTRERRPRAVWLVAAASVGAVVTAGLGGYALGVRSDDTVALSPASTEDTGGSGEAEVRLPENESPDGADELGHESLDGSDSADGAEDGQDSGAGLDSDLGPVRLTAGPDLPTTPETGEVTTFRSTGDVTERLQAWARALGTTDTDVTTEDHGGLSSQRIVDAAQGWSLDASVDATTSWFTFEDVYGSPYCAELFDGLAGEDLELARQDWATQYGPELAFPSEETCTPPTGPAPDAEEATRTARTALEDAGVDTGSWEFSVVDAGDEHYVDIQAHPADASPDGPVSALVTVSGDGVQSVYLSDGETVSLGEYPVIDAAAAVERFADPLFAQEYSVYLPPEEGDEVSPQEDDVLDDEELDAFPEAVDPLAPGDRIPLLLKEKTIVSAELVTGELWTGEGAYQVPVWKLVAEDGTYYPVVALADEAFDWTSWE